MVRDVHDALERMLGEAPAWQLDLDDVVAAGRRSERRRRAAVTAGSSAAVVFAAGAVLAAPAVIGQLHGTDPARVTVLGPAGRPATASRPPSARPVQSGDTAAERARREAFARAGYDRADAVLLARLWGGGTTPDGAEVRGGDKLMRGQSLPVRHGATAQTVTESVAMDAFFGNGNDYADAVRLAKLWHRPIGPGGDVSTVKAQAGRRILAGEALPTGH